MTSIRPATAADMAAVADLWHEGWHAGHAAHVPAGLTDLRTLAAFHERTPPRVGDTTVAVTDMERAEGALLGGQVWVSPCRRYVKDVRSLPPSGPNDVPWAT